MHFSKTVFVVVTMVLAVAASPIDIAVRNETPAQSAQQQCGTSGTLTCCTSVVSETFGALGSLLGIPISLPIGNGCNPINVLSILPINQICPTTVTCCQSGNQVGLVNIGNLCGKIL